MAYEEGTPSNPSANNTHVSNAPVNNGLFMDAAKKLKGVSKAQFVIGCIISLIVGISIWDDWGLRWLISIIIWILGPTLTYIQGLLLYAFAQMVDDISAVRKSFKA